MGIKTPACSKKKKDVCVLKKSERAASDLPVARLHNFTETINTRQCILRGWFLPILTPPGAKALLSPNTAFLLTVMFARSQSFSTLLPARTLLKYQISHQMKSTRMTSKALKPSSSILLPVNPRGLRSHRTRWFSVPSVTSLYPWPIK